MGLSWTPTSRLTRILTAGVLFVCLLQTELISSTSGFDKCPSGCRCDDNTLVVKCDEGVLDVLPIALNPFLKQLVIKRNKIKTIDASIQFYAELTYLDLSYNELQSIPQRTFAFQRNLRELYLNHNKIGQISNKTFIGLAALVVLDLRGNLLAELEQRTFALMPKIESLNLGQNRISYIDAHAFDDLINLRVLYLDDNTLTKVPDIPTFQNIPHLTELYLGTNSFMTISTNSFMNLTKLKTLNLHGAGVYNISKDAFKNLTALQSLDISDNRLQRIPTEALKHLTSLNSLSLGQNDFELIEAKALENLKYLQYLNITRTQHLKRINSNAFAANTNLKFLNLSDNLILSNIEPGAFNGLPQLHTLILRGNHLNTFSEELFLSVDHLLTLDLSSNPLICDCRLLWLRNLLTENATTNPISDIICYAPDNLRSTPLSQVSVFHLGCSHNKMNDQTVIGILLVATAGSVTALALVAYGCRRRIGVLLKGGWGNSALGRKENEYQKTFSDEEYITRQQPSTVPNVCIPPNLHQPPNPYHVNSIQNLNFNTLPVTEL